ncbi:MAG: type II toxin-antitoxin system Phd/YefM family antitoxin [Gemmatimonadales bacterium]
MRRITLLALQRNPRELVRALQRGERFLLTFRGRAIARLEPVQREEGWMRVDPIFRIDEFAQRGRPGKLANATIDQIVYGA